MIARLFKWGAMSLPFCFLLASCATETQPHDGLYEVVFDTDPPIHVLAERRGASWVVRNGEERISMKKVGLGLHQVPVFGGGWAGTWEGGEYLGVWTDSLRPNDYKVAFRCSPIEGRPVESKSPETTRWDTSEGLMTLRQCGDSLWGTIATPTGDYRYLAGTRSQNNCRLQTFDGAHLFGFFFEITEDDSLTGSFISGSHYVTKISGVLSASTSQASLSKTYQSIDNQGFVVRGVGLSGQEVSLEFNEHQGPMVVDIMGSWCPNCMDETRLLNGLSAVYPDVPIVTLAYERMVGEEAIRRLQAFQAEMNISWPVILAGPASKQHASDQFPILNGVQSFPTTLFWGGPSECVVHSGFSGPATGEGYKEEEQLFRAQFQRLNDLMETR